MSRVFRTTLVTGLPAGAVVALLFWSTTEEWWAAAVGVLVGLLLGLFLAGLMARNRSRMERAAPSFDGERLLRSGPANHSRGIESVGGWLYLTTRRLEFRPHAANIDIDPFTLELSKRVQAETRLTLGVIPNGLLVRHPGGAEEFVVEGNREWVTAIEEAVANASDV